MRLSVRWVLAAAALTLAVVVVVGALLVQPPRALVERAAFSLTMISPNADGVDDVTIFEYTLTRNAQVSLEFTAADGTVYIFRRDEDRIPGDYRVEFSGVVHGFVRPGETVQADVLRRLMPDGVYQWTLTASAQNGETVGLTGALTVQDADPLLPDLLTLDVSPNVFTPNQDGIYDRTQINVYLTKPAQLSVYLLSASGTRIPISARVEGRQDGDAGRHLFDYEGGVDAGMDPPPDGTYTVVADAQDDEGQQVRRTSTLTIQQGGDPQAEIAAQPIGVDVVFDVLAWDDRYLSSAGQLGTLIAPPSDPQSLLMTAIPVPLGDLLVFRLTVENYGNVPVRTAGPPPGTVYQQGQRTAALGYFPESGAWYVGIDCDTAVSDYPWRYAIGAYDTLDSVFDPVTGNTYYYLAPGKRSEVWGAIRMTDVIPARNPQNCWAGLIHQDVEVSIRNANVGSRQVELIDPSQGTTP